MKNAVVSGVEIVRIAKSAGFDALYIDLEPSSLTLQAASQISIMALGARYVSTGNDLAFLLAECTRRARQVKERKL
jgi:chitinase